jgi:hypothetical protein
MATVAEWSRMSGETPGKLPRERVANVDTRPTHWTPDIRTPLFLLVGFLLLAAFLLLGKLFSSNYPSAVFAATLVPAIVAIFLKWRIL